MANFIYSKTTEKGKQTFYLVSQGREYFLFTQKYYKGVRNYFQNKKHLDDALDVSKSRHDTALIKTMTKIPLYIKFIEKEFGIAIMKTSFRKNKKRKYNQYNRNNLFDSWDYQIA